MAKLGNQKIEFSVTCWFFPKWLEGWHAHGKGTDFEVELKNFETLEIIVKQETPYLNSYLTLNEKYINVFFHELTREIINKHKNVTSIGLKQYSQKIYNSELSKEISGYRNIFAIPPGDDILKIHKFKQYKNYFNPELFVSSGKEKTVFSFENIGFTGKSKEELSKGKEFQCSIIFDNNKTNKNDYIFLIDLQVIQKKVGSAVYEFYVLPKNGKEQLNNELKTLSERHSGFNKMTIKTKFLENDATKLLDINLDKYKFDKSIIFDYNYEYNMKGELVEIKNGKTTRGSSSANYIPSGNRLTNHELDIMRYDDKNFLDDLRSDSYLDMM